MRRMSKISMAIPVKCSTACMTAHSWMATPDVRMIWRFLKIMLKDLLARFWKVWTAPKLMKTVKCIIDIKLISSNAKMPIKSLLDFKRVMTSF